MTTTKNLEQLEKIARDLYGVVLHLQAISSDKPIAVIGDGLYQEAVNAIKAYEDYNANS